MTTSDAQAAWQLARIKDDAARAMDLDGPSLILLATMRCGTQAAVTAKSGITGKALAQINRLRRPTKAERSALIWAIVSAQL